MGPGEPHGATVLLRGNSIEMLPSPSGLKYQGSLRRRACHSQLHLELGHPTPRTQEGQEGGRE